MIRPGRRDIEIKRQQDFVLVVAFKGLDLEAGDLSLQVRANLADADPLLAADVAVEEGEIEEVASTIATFTIPEAEIDALDEPSPAGSPLPAFYGIKLEGVEWVAGAALIMGQANHA